jgi:hypothetical protein
MNNPNNPNNPNTMRITFHGMKQKVEVHDNVPYFIGASTTNWTMQDVLNYLSEYKAWSWTTDVPVEEMLDTKVYDMAILGEFTCKN